MKWGIKCVLNNKSLTTGWEQTSLGFEAWCKHFGDVLILDDLNDAYQRIFRWHEYNDPNIYYYVKEYS